MSAISGTAVLAFFFLTAWIFFSGLLDVTTGQTDALKESNERHENRLGTLISIRCTSGSTGDYTLGVLNRGNQVSFADFSDLDFLTRYSNAMGDVVSRRLVQTADWVISSITGDTNDPRIWDPGETVYITFTLVPQPRCRVERDRCPGRPSGPFRHSLFRRLGWRSLPEVVLAQRPHPSHRRHCLPRGANRGPHPAHGDHPLQLRHGPG